MILIISCCWNSIHWSQWVCHCLSIILHHKMLKHLAQQNSKDSWVLENVWPIVTWSLDKRKNYNNHFFSGRLPANDLYCNFCKGRLAVEIYLGEVLKWKMTSITLLVTLRSIGISVRWYQRWFEKKVCRWWHQREGAAKGGIPSTEHNSKVWCI